MVASVIPSGYGLTAEVMILAASIRKSQKLMLITRCEAMSEGDDCKCGGTEEGESGTVLPHKVELNKRIKNGHPFVPIGMSAGTTKPA